jgi:hypothetical protein
MQDQDRGYVAISAVFIQKYHGKNVDGQNAQFSWPGLRTMKEPSQTQPRLAEKCYEIVSVSSRK